MRSKGTSRPCRARRRHRFLVGRAWRQVLAVLWMVVPVPLLSGCSDEPMWLDGVLPARFTVAPVWGLVVGAGLLGVLAAGVGAWARGSTGRLRGAW